MEEVVEMVRSMDEADVDSLLERAKQCYDKGCEVCVIELLRDYEGSFRRRGYGWLIYGDSLRVIGKFNEAELALKKALRLAPVGVKSYVLTRLALLYQKHRSPFRAAVFFRLAVELDEERTGWVYLLAGENFILCGDFCGALECLQTAEKVSDVAAKSEVYYGIAVAYRAMGDYGASIAAGKRSIELRPSFSKAKKLVRDLEEANALSSHTECKKAE